MQQDNKYNIENKLVQLETQQLPDLSNMDKHWREMEQMLGAGAQSKATRSVSFFKFYARKLFIAASLILVVFAAWLFRSMIKTPEKKTITAKVVAPLKEKQIMNDTQTAAVITKQPDPIPAVQKNTNTQSNQDTETAQVANVIDMAEIEAADEAKAREAIASFYRNIQNPVQEFKINADQGATLTGNQGTVFNIPASAFVEENGKIVSGDVKISVEEFYKYADMVAANLTTVSNGKQLISGGMVKITAVNNNGAVLSLRANKDIGLLMPAANYDSDMKLFTTQSETGDKIESAAMYASYPAQERSINWEQTGQQTAYFAYDNKTLFPDRLDQPYSVIKTGRKIIAKFALSKKSSLSTQQMEVILKQKLGEDYDEIVVIRDGEPRKASTFLHRGTIDMESVIGDSIRLTLQHALRGKYIEKTDSAFYAARIKLDSTRFANEFSSKQTVYSFSIKKMGWVNADKYCNLGNKTNLVINLPEDVKADKFVSQVVFMSTRSSVMPGRAINNQIGFHDIPANVGVYVVGIGIKNGKVVSFMQKLRVDKPEVTITDLQETTPEAFRKKLSELDMN